MNDKHKQIFKNIENYFKNDNKNPNKSENPIKNKQNKVEEEKKRKLDVVYFSWKKDEFILHIGEKNENCFPVELNPYKVLEINKKATIFEIELAFKKKLFEEPYNRAEICLAYEILNNSLEYIKLDEKSDNFRVYDHNEIYYTVVGDYRGLSFNYLGKKNIINSRDKTRRSLLFIAATNGHYKVCEYLLENGADVNECNINKSTALHSAVYHGHEDIIHLLISYGADINQKNELGQIPSDEAPSNRYKNKIREYSDDIILNIYYYLKSIGLVDRMIKVKKYNNVTKTEDFIAIKFIPDYKLLLPDAFNDVWKNWDAAWHGTKLQYIASILKNGLKEAGSLLKDEGEITPQEGHIPHGERVNDVDDWANAIFVSPSVFYSTHPIYAERIKSIFYGKTWAVLVETRLRPGSYGSYHTTTYRKIVPGEPQLVEYRVKSVDPLNSKRRNIHVIAVTFILEEFLNKVKEYDQGDILSKSEVERILYDD